MAKVVRNVTRIDQSIHRIAKAKIGRSEFPLAVVETGPPPRRILIGSVVEIPPTRPLVDQRSTPVGNRQTEPQPRRFGVPPAVVKRRIDPGQAQRVIRGNQVVGGVAFVHENGLTFLRVEHAIGDVLQLLRKSRVVLVDHVAGVVHQGEVVPIAAKLEVRMQFPSRIPPILIRSEDHKVALCRQGHRGEFPLVQFIDIVGKIPSVQIYGVAGGVLKFDPIGGFTVFIEPVAVFDGHKLADEDISGKQQARLKGLQHRSNAAMYTKTAMHRIHLQ